MWFSYLTLDAPAPELDYDLAVSSDARRDAVAGGRGVWPPARRSRCCRRPRACRPGRSPSRAAPGWRRWRSAGRGGTPRARTRGRHERGPRETAATVAAGPDDADRSGPRPGPPALSARSGSATTGAPAPPTSPGGWWRWPAIALAVALLVGAAAFALATGGGRDPGPAALGPGDVTVELDIEHSVFATERAAGRRGHPGAVRGRQRRPDQPRADRRRARGARPPRGRPRGAAPVDPRRGVGGPPPTRR